MRSATATALLLLAAAIGAGCDTTQPLQVGQQTFSVTFTAPGGTVEGIDTYRLIEDSDPEDSLPDGGVSWIWCERPSPGPPAFSATSLPWSFTFTASILKSTAATPTEVASSSGLGNVAQFDPNVITQGVTVPPILVPSLGNSNQVNLFLCAGDGQTSCTIPTEDTDCGAFADTTCERRVFKWDQPSVRSAANPDVVIAAATGNPLNLPGGCLVPTLDAQMNCGECPRLIPGGFDFPVGGPIPTPFPQIVSEVQPYDTVVDKGDTVIIESVWVDTSMPYVPAWYGRTGMPVATPPAVSAAAALGGVTLSGDLLEGNLTASNQSGSFISFSYTSR